MKALNRLNSLSNIFSIFDSLNLIQLKKLILISAAAMLLFGCTKEEANTISAVRINKITVIDYPITNGAVPWDDPIIGSSTGADVSWSISGPQSFTSAIYFPDASGASLEFTGNGFPISLNSPQGTYTIQLIDIDDLDGSDFASSDDVMGSFSFVPYSPGSKGSEIIEYTENDITVQLDVTYLFE